uniref:Apoptosis, caspase activation inhibitor n=1 Tax=Seriola dumerili TaxID=41447 RepID=A0A3B4TQP7_SERDU
MESRPSRGRGGSWKRGGRGGHDSDSFGGEHRGRGRGGHHRGRGKRDHYRGRGRGGSAHATEFHNRHQDEGDNVQEEDDRREVFSRRKLESNWDRYAESEKQEPDDNMPTQRGTDYLVLLESAGDSFTQFRLAEEKDWEMDLFTASQMSAGFVDLPALAQTLQRVPLHQRLNLEAELVQVGPLTAKAQSHSVRPCKVPVATNPVSTSNASKLPEDDGDEELDQLLSLEKPVSGVVGNQSASVTDEERVSPEEGEFIIALPFVTYFCFPRSLWSIL